MGRRPAKKQKKRLFKDARWQQCYEQWLSSIPADSTRKLYDCYLYTLFTDGKSPDKKSRADIETWLSAPTGGAARTGHPPSPYTINKRRQVLSSFFRWCEEYPVPFRNTMRPILRARVDKGIKPRKVPMPERDMEDGEIERFLSAIDTSTVLGTRDYAFFFTLLITGRRLSEIARLRWGDIQPVIFVENGRTRAGWTYSWQGKGHASKDDSAEWPAACMTALQTYLEMAGKWGNMHAADPLFVPLPGQGGIDREWPEESVKNHAMEVRFRMYATAAGLPHTRVVHSLRHESAWLRYCEYCEHGRDIQAVQAVQEDLRHASSTTTLKYLNRRRKRTQSDPIAAKLAARFASTGR